ncbi:MAG TPA: methylated-DNA--[protein]-cysteine S-methyltransferase [Sedimentisphaerales bacterium]|nr:methylated-DNA--[protein]-cysteine S-methyltransferase [Sedimentisphaerales bacterium]
MHKNVKYTAFETKWGYFGLAATENAILRTQLPLSDCKKAKKLLLSNLPPAQYDKTLLYDTQLRITAYFEGSCVDFGDTPVLLDEFSLFTRLVLTACKSITFGRTITYGQLARTIHHPAAWRAVGSALAKNPLPLIIPCHRVIYSNGGLGGFSAYGALRRKAGLLDHEKKALTQPYC